MANNQGGGSIAIEAEATANNVNTILQSIQTDFQGIRAGFNSGENKTKEELERILQSLTALAAEVTTAEDTYTVKFEELSARASSVKITIIAENEFTNSNSLVTKATKLKRLEEKIGATERDLKELRSQITNAIGSLRTKIGENSSST